MAKQLTIEEINNLDCAEFTHMFKNVIENYGFVAFQLSRDTFHNVMDIYAALCNLLDRMDIYRKERILRDYPGLMTKLGELIGLTAEDKRKLLNYTEEYELKFGFSFVICHKEYKIEDILHNLKHRLTHDRKFEIEVAITQIKKISKYHILSLIKHEYA